MDSKTLLEIGIKKRNKEIDLSWQELAEQYGGEFFQDGDTYRCWVKNQVYRNGAGAIQVEKSDSTEPTTSFKDTVEINRDGSQTSSKLIRMSFDDTKSPEKLLEYHGYDKTAWELVSARSNIWNAFSKETGVVQLYASRISVKPSAEEEIIELQKQKIKVQDQRREYNDLIKKQARFEHLKEEIHKSILKLAEKKPLVFEHKSYKTTNVKANVLFSDFHYGASFSNSLNTYNPKIFNERFQIMVNDIIKYGKLHNVDYLTIANLGDAIAGAIHVANRVQSSEDLIEQLKYVTESIAECLAELSDKFKKIRYINVIGNHSRAQSNKTENLLNENFEKLIPWYLEARLKDFKNIEICCDTDGYYIDDTFEPCHIYVHGDLDNVSSAAKNLPQVLGTVGRYIFMGHIHHETLKDFGKTRVISNGSLMGVDDYAVGKRYFAEPVQLMHIFDEQGRIQHHIPIYLD